MTITLTSLLTIAFCSFVSAAAGYWFGISQKANALKKIRHLETEMLNCHAEILRLSEELAKTENLQNKTLVVSIKEAVTGKTEKAK